MSERESERASERAERIVSHCIGSGQRISSVRHVSAGSRAGAGRPGQRACAVLRETSESEQPDWSAARDWLAGRPASQPVGLFRSPCKPLARPARRPSHVARRTSTRASKRTIHFITEPESADGELAGLIANAGRELAHARRTYRRAQPVARLRAACEWATQQAGWRAGGGQPSAAHKSACKPHERSRPRAAVNLWLSLSLSRAARARARRSHLAVC